jgi:mono/diheme cytochrome c family protein
VIRRIVPLWAGLAILSACEKPEMVPPSPEERVAEAEAAYDPARFDTIQWASSEERLRTGNEVFAVECRACHGPLGRGDTPYARERGLDVPSLVDPDGVGDDLEAVRRRIFTGHPAGMPVWGIGGITPREIDAVAYYLLHQLRPDAAAQ